jgi:hypothetical protein
LIHKKLIENKKKKKETLNAASSINKLDIKVINESEGDSCTTMNKKEY